MRLSLSQNLRTEQRLVQSPQMIQAMQVLQYPLIELQDRIEQELQENVFLETLELDPKVEDSQDRPPPERPKTERTPEEIRLERSYETLEQLERRTQDLSPAVRRFRGDDEDAKHEALNNTPGPGETLSEHLVSQIALLDLHPELRDRVELIIYSLDKDGRLTLDLDELRLEAGCSPEEMEEALLLVQGLDPTGVGARDLKECLLLQLASLPGSPSVAFRIVEAHLENLSMNRLPRIARETCASIDEIKDAIEFIRKNLHPHPGAQFEDVRNQTVAPDIVVDEIDGRFELRVEKGGIPHLRLSSIYRKLLQESKTDPKVQEYLRRKIESAKWFIDAIHQRQTTIERIANAIIDRQAEFLRKGIRFLKPLRMQDIADEVGVHISTVSRAISGKYIQTPQGIFDMKRFFSAGTRSDSGEFVSQQAVKQKLREIIDGENRKNPLSDDAIVHILDQQGIHIARRTVTKYRKALGIRSSNQRKAY
ncbi:MAG: RNA polymerase factor sigma-54 [Planctomycetota bacterium]